jgi:predicted Zn-dependent protease
MKKHYWIDAGKLLVVFGIIWAGFSLIPWSSFHVPKGADLLSLQREKQLGKALLDQSVLAPDAKNKLVRSVVIDSAFDIISKRLLARVDSPLFDYHFYVVESKEVNAYTLPGGNIVVYTGLLKFCETPEDLAAVLAHELGHAQKRHVVTKLINELGITILLSVGSGGSASVIREVLRTAVSSSFGRDMEREADEFSFSLMEKAKLDPTTLSEFFRRMKKQSGEDTDLMEFLNTHPSNTDRIRAALEYKTAPGFKIEPIPFDWKSIQAELTKETPEKDKPNSDQNNEDTDTRQ